MFENGNTLFLTEISKKFDITPVIQKLLYKGYCCIHVYHIRDCDQFKTSIFKNETSLKRTEWEKFKKKWNKEHLETYSASHHLHKEY